MTTETRFATTDPSSRRRFARYWVVVGPLSAAHPATGIAQDRHAGRAPKGAKGLLAPVDDGKQSKIER